MLRVQAQALCGGGNGSGPPRLQDTLSALQNLLKDCKGEVLKKLIPVDECKPHPSTITNENIPYTVKSEDLNSEFSSLLETLSKNLPPKSCEVDVTPVEEDNQENSSYHMIRVS